MNVSKTITIDLNRPRKNVVHLGQDDNVREVLVNLLADGVPYDITADAPSGSFVFTVKYIKSNGIPGEYATTSTGLDAVTKVDNTVNQYIVRLDEHATDVPGFADAFLTIYETTGTPKVLHSFPITVDVVRTTADGTDPSAPYYNGTPYLVKAKQATKTAAMTQPVGVDANGKLWTTPGGGGGGGSIGLLMVHLAYSDGTYITDTSSYDIFTAWSTGYVIKLKDNLGIEYDLQNITSSSATFYGTVDLTNGIGSYTYTITGTTVTRIAHQFGGAPLPTVADNGRFLTVSGGVYALVTIPAAESEAF